MSAPTALFSAVRVGRHAPAWAIVPLVYGAVLQLQAVLPLVPSGTAAYNSWSLAIFLIFDVPKTFGKKYAKVRYCRLMLLLGAVLLFAVAAVLPLEWYCRCQTG